MKRLTATLFLTITVLLGSAGVSFAGTYQIDGGFDGCEYGKLYPLLGGGILECREYNYFYEYSPEIRSDGRDVITIGDEKVDAYLHDGSVIETQVYDDFEGCDFDKKIKFVNGLTFICSTYSYTYSYMPEVKIMMISGQPPKVYIGGEQYDGTLYR